MRDPTRCRYFQNQDKGEFFLQAQSCSVAFASLLRHFSAIGKRKKKKDRHNLYVLDDFVRVKVRSAEEWLCVSRLPTTTTEEELEALAAEYGKVEETVMVHSDRTGRTRKINGFGLRVGGEA